MINRRNFLATMAAAATLPRALAGETWRGWTPGHFQIHEIYTGVCESQFLVFPDGTTMLIDCGDHPALTRQELAVPVKPNPGRLAGEWIARYVGRVNPNGNDVDYLQVSHWHADHAGCRSWVSAAPQKVRTGCTRSGLGLAVEQLHFKTAIDRGYPNYDDPLPPVGGEAEVMDHVRRIYAYLAKRDGLTVERFRLGATDQVVPRRGTVPGFSVRNICANGRIAAPDGTVRDLYARFFDGAKRPTRLNENAMSLGQVFTYGAFSFFSAGDFSDGYRAADGSRHQIEDDLADVVGPVSVAKINHHGHHSMPAKLVKALRPRVWTACVWDQLHTVPSVLERLARPDLYGDREPALVCSGVFPVERQRAEGGATYFARLARESFACGHVVIDVPPGGETFTVSYLTADDESMRVTGTYSFTS